MSANGDGDGEPFRVVSTNRPLPRQARGDLEEFGIVGELTAEEVENPPLGVSPQTVVGLLTEERPTDDALDRSELKVIEDPIETWEGRGAEVRIYPTKVVSTDDGEMNLDPEEAAEFLREQEDFSPVDVPDDSPFGPTPDDLLTPEEGRAQAREFRNENSTVGRWRSIPESEWDDERARFSQETVAEWASPKRDGGRIYVTVSMDPNDGEDDEPPTFDVNATAVGDFKHSGGPAVGGVLEDDIDSVLEGTLSWMENRPAVTNYPTFRAEVKKGVIHPVFDMMDRISGGMALLEADEQGIRVYTGGLSQVEYDLPASDMEDYTLRAAGACVLKQGELLDGIADANYKTTVAIEGVGSERAFVFNSEQADMWTAASTPNGEIEVEPGSAQTIVDGDRFEEGVSLAADLNGKTEALLAIQDSTTWIAFKAVVDPADNNDDDNAPPPEQRLQGDTLDELKYDFRGRSAIGNAATTVRMATLKSIQKPFSRPSRNDVTFNIEDGGMVVLNYNQRADYASGNGGNVSVALRKSGSSEGFDMRPPEATDLPEGVSPLDASSLDEPKDRVSGVTDAIEGLFEVGQEARNHLFDAQDRDAEEEPIIQRLEDWAGALEEVRPDLLSQLVGDPTEEAVDTAEVFIENLETLNDAAEDLLSMTEDDPDLPETDAIPGFEREFSDEETPEATGTEESPDTISEPSKFTNTPGSWDVALVARPGRPWGERYDAVPLDPDDRRNPSISVTDDVKEEIEDKFRGVPAAQYQDGDVVALAGVDNGVRGGVDVRSFSARPGAKQLRARTIDPSDDSLTITPDDGWVGIHPKDVFKLDDGDLTAGWTTAPARNTDSRNNFHVWWGGRMEKAYHYRDTGQPPYFVYEWDTSDEAPMFQTGTLADNPGQRYHLWARKVPDGDEAIGLVDGTDTGPTPSEPVFRSEYEDEYEIDPFIRSQDAASELIGETILARTGGVIREAEVTGETRGAAGIQVADETIPDGFWAVPASSEHEDSTFELVGIPRGNDDVVRDVDVFVTESSGGFSEGSPRISLKPEIGDDPNEIGTAIRSNISDTFPRDGLRRFYTNQREQIATAKVRGGDLVEEEVGAGMTTEKLSEPLELVGVEYSADTPEGRTNPTAEEIREAYPALSTPQAESVAELVWDVGGVLQFTPTGLMSVDGIGDSTVGDLIGGDAGFKATTPIGEQGAERADVEQPSDDFGRTIEGTFSDEVIEEGEVEEEVVEEEPAEGGPYTEGTGGKVQVGRRTIDVPKAGDYGELRFYWKNDAGSSGLDGDGAVAAYISRDRTTVLTIEGTRVSNKWGMKAYVHENGVGGSPSLEEATGQSDATNVDRVTLTSGNTADSSAEGIIADEWLSPGEANEAVRQSGGTDVFSWDREFESDVQTFPIKINVFGQLGAERSEDGRKMPREVLDEVFERVEEQIGDPEQYVSGDVADREEMLVGGADVDVGGVLQGAEPEIIDVDAFEPVDDDGEPVEGDDTDEPPEPPEPEPPRNTRADLPDDSATVGITADDLEGTGWVHIERDLSDPAEILLLNDDRTVGLFGRRVKLSDQTLIEWTGIQYAEAVPDGEVRGSGSPSVDNQELIDSNTDIADLAASTVRENTPEAVLDAIGARGGTGEEEVSETLSELASALTDADNLLDAARDAGVMGTQELQRIQRSQQELERRVEALENVPMSSDVEDANEAIRRFRNREEEATEVVEDAAEADDGPDELTRAEVETIVENATEGVSVNAPFPAGDLAEIQMRSVGDFDIPDRINAGIGADTPREAVRIAVERWEERVDLSKVDAERLNSSRQALNRQFSLDLPMIETEQATPEPTPEPGDEQGVDAEGDIPAQLEELFAAELGGLGLPSRPRPPADFVVEEDMGRISARPNVPPEWEPVLKEQPGVVTGSLDDPEGFLADYLERLFQAIDFSKVDAGAINQKRGRLNERFGLDLPLLNAQGDPRPGTEAGDDTQDEQPGGEGATTTTEPLRVEGGVYVVPDDVPAGTAQAAREQAEAALGPADQFDNNTRVGDAIIQDGQVAVRVEEGERILDARRQQQDLEERTPDFDMDAPLTAETVRKAFPRMLGNGEAFADEFDTLGGLVNAPLSDLESIYGVGMGTIEDMIDNPDPDMSASIMDQRRRPLGIEDDVPDDSPMPEIKTDEEVEDVPEGTTGGIPEVAVSIPPTAPRGEKWMAQQIQRGNRIQPNKYDKNPIVEIVFPERISGRVRNVVSQHDISRGGQVVSVQNPSFRDELPNEAASLKSIQFLLSGGSTQLANDLRSSGYDIQQIINDLSDRLIIVTRSPVVRAPITFPN